MNDRDWNEVGPEELERIAAEAARLPRLSPSHDLWPEIAARLGPQERARHIFGLTSSHVRLATAASLLIAATAGITWSLATRGTDVPVVATSPVPSTATGASRADGAAGLVRPASMDAAVATLDREIATLQAIVDDRRSTRDPRTVAVLEENLALIDRAIAESRAALAADPASRFLATQFARAYTSKLTLLRDAATLPAGT